ncbi:MAG: NAD-dependent epimerase/dehydratase family protein [Nitrososphaeraceae archaeon]|nr:NAD-dependent epimerase/dehydratase family protein [Nitrososphaeraceae archaeon]
MLIDVKGTSVLVTGGCGFLGSEVVKQLSRGGSQVTVFDNLSSGRESYILGQPGVSFIKGDLTDESAMIEAMKDVEYVLHLAALPFIPDSYYYPRDFFTTNVNATIGLALEAIRKRIKRFVYISSSEVYGSAKYTPMDENHPTLPQSTYSVSKLAAERVVYTMHREHDLPVVIIRPFNSFGPNITQPYIIPEVVNQLINGKKDVKLGNIHSRRDFTFVSDTARGIIQAMITDGINGETINIGTGKSVQIRELVGIIADIMSHEPSITIDASRIRPDDVETLICDYSKANRLLGWSPTVSLRHGLEVTIDWIRKNGVAIKTSFRGWPATYRGSFDNNFAE